MCPAAKLFVKYNNGFPSPGGDVLCLLYLDTLKLCLGFRPLAGMCCVQPRSGNRSLAE